MTFLSTNTFSARFIYGAEWQICNWTFALLNTTFFTIAHIQLLAGRRRLCGTHCDASLQCRTHFPPLPRFLKLILHSEGLNFSWSCLCDWFQILAWETARQICWSVAAARRVFSGEGLIVTAKCPMCNPHSASKLIFMHGNYKTDKASRKVLWVSMSSRVSWIFLVLLNKAKLAENTKRLLKKISKVDGKRL